MAVVLVSCCGPKEARTPDLCNAIAALYQLSYGPTAAQISTLTTFVNTRFWEHQTLYSARRTLRYIGPAYVHVRYIGRAYVR